MEILSVDTNAELKRAKNIMLWGFFAYVVCYLLSLPPIPIIAHIASLGTLIAWIAVCYGLYCFSKLTHSPCFKYYMFSVLAIIAYYIILFAVLGYVYSTVLEYDTTQALQEILPWLSLSVFVIIISLATLATNLYLTYKLYYEMANLTGLKQFIFAFNLYVIATIGLILLSLVFGYLLYDFVQIYTDVLLDSDVANYFSEFIQGRVASFIMLVVLFCVMGIVYIVSYIFVALGVWNIKEAQVRH